MNDKISDKRNMQLLALLDKNSRTSVNELARKLKLSKDAVKYRINNLEKEEIITRYFADIDVSKIGLILNKAVFKFQNTTKSKELEIFEFLMNCPKIGWVSFCSGAWDGMIVIYTKDLYEYNEIIKKINEKYGQYIHTKAFVAHPDYYVCNRRWLTDKSENIISHIGGPIEKTQTDEIDRTILKNLSKNSRISILSLAEKVKLSSAGVIRRIKILENERVILNYRIGLNLDKLKKEFCKSFIYLQNTNNAQQQRIISYCLNHKNVTAVTNSIGSWDFELEMEVSNFEEFYRIMNEIKNEFKEYIKNYEAVVITKETGINYANIL